MYDKPESAAQFMFRELLDAKTADRRFEWFDKVVAEADVSDLIYGAFEDYQKHGDMSRIEMLVSVVESKIAEAAKPKPIVEELS